MHAFDFILVLFSFVFVCRDQANAKEFCRAADSGVTAAHAYGGEYASDGATQVASAWSSSPSVTSTTGACSGMRFRHFRPSCVLRWSTTAQRVRAIRGSGRFSRSQRRRSETASLPLARGSRRD